MIKYSIFLVSLFAAWWFYGTSTTKIAELKQELSLSAQTVTSAKFTVGDCVSTIASRDREEWEGPRVVEKIVAIGNKAYRTVLWLDTYWGDVERQSHSLSFIWNESYEKVECPE